MEQNAGVDLSEKGRSTDGEAISLDRRLFMQLLAFSGCSDSDKLIDELNAAALPAVLYEDVNDPTGVALLAYHQHPDYFLGALRDFFRSSSFANLLPRPELTMLGRTYSLGYESDLERTLITRPIEKVCDPSMPWAIWYPLRRNGAFEQLSAEEQRVILMEHGGIGRAFGRAGYGTDIRLACHGLNQEDNDFVVGLLGPDLFPLSAIVQRMRKTQQTALYLDKLGPFFVGKVVWQSTGANL